MTDVEMKQFLFSLAWATWSCYHNSAALEMIKEHCPDVDAKEELKKFCEIIESPAGIGSPKYLGETF